MGPGHTSKQQVRLGQEIPVDVGQVRAAGRYLAILCSSTGCESASFFVTPAPTASLSFLVHPSRVPVKLPNAISGVAFPYDKFDNLVFTPVTIDFQLKAGAGDSTSRPVPTQNGVAWFRANSGNQAGAAQVAASVGDLSVRRVVQQVASDPCNLRIKGQRTRKGHFWWKPSRCGIVLETPCQTEPLSPSPRLAPVARARWTCRSSRAWPARSSWRPDRR